MLCDGGASVDCRPEMLLQFGLMGSAYMKRVMGIEKPRVGLANVGTEAHKGDELRHQAFELLSQCGDIHFVGNVEARDILTTPATWWSPTDLPATCSSSSTRAWPWR